MCHEPPDRVQRSIATKVLQRWIAITRKFLPNTRARQLHSEISFWRAWLTTEGLDWPDDFRMRLQLEAPLSDRMANYVGQLAGHQISILDVGAGPLTKVGKIHASKAIAITAIDVLAKEYSELLREFGVVAPVPTIHGDAECLVAQFGESRFDLVNAENSLDHTRDPVRALDQMLAVTRPGGFVLLRHAENEGRREKYDGLHQWDFRCENGHFIIQGPGPHGLSNNVTLVFSSRAEIACSIHEGNVLVHMRKLAPS